MCTRGLARVAFLLLPFPYILDGEGQGGRGLGEARAAAVAVRDSYSEDLSAALQDIVQLSAPSYQKTSLRAAMTEVSLQARHQSQTTGLEMSGLPSRPPNGVAITVGFLGCLAAAAAALASAAAAAAARAS